MYPSCQCPSGLAGVGLDPPQSSTLPWWERLLQTGERVLERVTNDDERPSWMPAGAPYTPPYVPYGEEEPAAASMESMLPLLVIGVLAIVLLSKGGR